MGFFAAAVEAWLRMHREFAREVLLGEADSWPRTAGPMEEMVVADTGENGVKSAQVLFSG